MCDGEVSPGAVAGNSRIEPTRARPNALGSLPFKGIHRWIFYAACTCVEHTALDDIGIIDLLYAATRGVAGR